MSLDKTFNSHRRQWIKAAGAGAAYGMFGAVLPSFAHAQESGSDPMSTQIADKAKGLAAGKSITLTIMEPSGSLGNIKPVADEWTKRTGIKINYVEVPLEQINQKVMLEAVSKSGTFDIALPATFGLPDLVASGILLNLDDLKKKHEPEGYTSDMLYTIGNYYKGSFYGYGTDGDTYTMFYLKDWLDNPDEKKAFSDQYGYELAVPKTWEQLDQMMAFFNRPDKGMYGGALFRTLYFIAWEWWSRFHAKGYFPFSEDMQPLINNDAGVAALEELTKASKSLYPGARTNGLFENFQAFGAGDKFCNIGWGGTQKYLNSEKSAVKGKLAFSLLPGGIVDGKFLNTAYFNWGWNYVVSKLSQNQELAYLFTLYACSPHESTVAIRYQDGYFDPYRKVHFKDPWVIKAYSEPFLENDYVSLSTNMPDLYLHGHEEYFTALRENIQAADVGQKTAKKALDDTAKKWDRITNRLGRKSQAEQWAFLKGLYPKDLRSQLKG